MRVALILGFLLLFSLAIWYVNRAPSKTDNQDWADMPALLPLSQKPQSSFLLTPENAIPAGKNAVYAPAFLFAWDKIKTALGAPVEITPRQSADFVLLNNSHGFEKSLDSSEYTAETLVDGKMIEARVFFNKKLPFATVLHRWSNPIAFTNKEVTAFGLEYADKEISSQFSMLYYKNDEEFILRLQPKDSTQEIILCKGLRNKSSLGSLQQECDSLIRVGKQQSAITSNSVLYTINRGDRIGIPVIRFNLDTDYPNLISQTFRAGSDNYTIVKAYQRTALILEEHGAVAESEAVVAVDTTIAAAPVLDRPKFLLFNKPFFLLLRKKEVAAPYFMLWIENAELLTPYPSK
jgi:hypothetical protein